jgi:hypothetical protein
LSVRTTYATGEYLDDSGWSIVAAPTGISQAARIIVPQGGEIQGP